MLDASHTEESLEQSLQLLGQCPSCNKEYSQEGLVLVEEGEGARLIHMTCADCSTAVLAVVASSQLGMSSVGVITDLTAHDAYAFWGRDSFSEDDILDFYAGLRSSGSLEQALMGQEHDMNSMYTL